MVSNGNAVVQEITQTDLDKITETADNGTGDDKKTDENTTISIDVSNAKSEVTSVELSGTSLEKIAKTVETSEKVDKFTPAAGRDVKHYHMSEEPAPGTEPSASEEPTVAPATQFPEYERAICFIYMRNTAARRSAGCLLNSWEY